jgi:UbiD family decarboxylase
LAKQDLQTWLAELEAAGDVQHVTGADRETEIGGIVDIYQRKMGRQCLLFDDIPGFKKGYRVMANILTSVPRINRTLGLAPEAPEVDLVRYWRDYFRNAKMIPPVTVNGGALMENVHYDGDIDLLKIPAPRWHELDGGYYIGTGCMVIMKDPDSGWINYGAYRIQAHDKQLASVMTSKGKHGNLIMRKYHERGEPCPIAVVVGMHPALFMVAGLEIPYGKNEYDAAGGLLGEPVEIINGPMTGLPIPAHAEIAFEGTVSPNDFVEEGPLGEWTGYYAGGRKPEPAIRISSLMHRNNPILLGAVPAVPPNDDTFYRGTYRSGAVWHQLEAAGIPEIKGVWAHPAGGGRLWLTVAIKQMYGGHSKQAGLVASQCHAGAYSNRVVIVVDDDINPADMDEVVWAISTRMDAREDLQVLNGCWSTHLDPMSYPEGLHAFNSRVVIDACKPWARKDTFPPVARSSKTLDDHIKAKFSKVLPKQ